MIGGYYKPGKRMMVMKTTTRPGFNSVEVEGRRLSFGRKNYFYVKDAKLARDIQQKYPNEVTMGPLQFAEPGHKYTFAGVDIPKKNVDGKVKTVNGVKYIYVKGRLQLAKEGRNADSHKP